MTFTRDPHSTARRGSYTHTFFSWISVLGTYPHLLEKLFDMANEDLRVIYESHLQVLVHTRRAELMSAPADPLESLLLPPEATTEDARRTEAAVAQLLPLRRQPLLQRRSLQHTACRIFLDADFYFFNAWGGDCDNTGWDSATCTSTSFRAST